MCQICSKYDLSGEQNISVPERGRKLATYRRFYVQDLSVPAAAQDMNVPDVGLFDLAGFVNGQSCSCFRICCGWTVSHL